MTSCQHIIKGASVAAPMLISPWGRGANKAGAMGESCIVEKGCGLSQQIFAPR